jgi:hypothetical protein
MITIKDIKDKVHAGDMNWLFRYFNDISIREYKGKRSGFLHTHTAKHFHKSLTDKFTFDGEEKGCANFSAKFGNDSFDNLMIFVRIGEYRAYD